ncbi:MAG: HD domain-containing phosphohydrolase [Burkholderiales bacterium]|jgi:HD-GYP domain-containing protein (c-di-GMP phosphodiesterase class II)
MADDLNLPDSKELLLRLDELHEVGISLSRQKDTPRLLEAILVAAKKITNADGGTLYRVDSARQIAQFEILRTDSLGIAVGGSTGTRIPFYPVRLYDQAGQPNTSMVVAYSVLNDCTVNIANAYEAEGFDFSGTREFDRKTGYRSQSFLTVPMKDHDDQIIGVLQLINAKHRTTGEIVPFSDADQKLAESLASQAAVALTNRQLIEQLEDLFESFIGLINAAIDDKSPYTAGHCQRVPALTMMLAEAAAESREGALANFSLSDKDRYELRMAGLLHDCGKVTTPVHVVDKATKLQTIYDRIGVINTRFEVIKRDAEIRMLNEKLAAPENRNGEWQQAEEAYEATCRRIEHDRNFLRLANIGAEKMPAEDHERVLHVSQTYRWRDAAGREVDFLTEDELENLTIRSGTLTQEERQIINRHIDVTIKMLESLPWPNHLRNVPEYAGGHHERMDGKGYPRGLTGEQMSVQARVMAIADIFEALTARDRPYKRANTLSESLEILRRFRDNGHIDPDLFDVFVNRKVYAKYAQQFLDPEQIDQVAGDDHASS